MKYLVNIHLFLVSKFKYLLALALFLYGYFYHITSSEFWPVTISKTWFNLANFEDSVLQKPLLSLFLSLFHLLPLTNVQHILLVKAVFCVIGVVFLFTFAVFSVHGLNLNLKTKYNWPQIQLNLLLLLALSPTVLNNFFSIRSDQLASLVFCVFLILCELKYIRISFLVLLLLPLTGVKEAVFLIPGAFYYFLYFREHITKKIIFFTFYTSLTVFIWVLALNMQATFYFTETYKGIQPKEQFGSYYLLLETPALIFAFIFNLYLFLIRDRELYKILFTSSLFFIILLVFPQPYQFFIASVVPFIYLPFFLGFSKLNFKYKWPVLFIAFLFITGMHTKNNRWKYLSNTFQIEFLKKASPLLEEKKFSYLDGMGLFPREKFHPCFVSPFDDLSNASCWHRVRYEKPDSIIITNRLAFLGEDIFKAVEDKYQQIYPNFWIRNDLVTADIKAKTNLKDFPLPVLIF